MEKLSRTEISNKISESDQRVRQMRGAVDQLNRRLEDLDQRQRSAKGREASLLAREVEAAELQRRSARELLAEAERQLAERQEAYAAHVDDTMANLGQIGTDCQAAARRFDEGLNMALGALAELEEAAEPLGWTLLAEGPERYTGRQALSAAWRSAFGDMLGPVESRQDRIPMIEHVARMLRDARENAAKIKAEKKKEAA